MKRTIGLLVLLAVALGAVAVAGASSSGDERVLRSELIGNVAKPLGGATIFGVDPAGASWVVASSDVDARRDGRLKVKFEGLLLVNTGTVGNNTAVTASLYCDGKLVGTTDPFALSPEGDGETDTTIAAAPKPCRVPTVFVSPNGRPNVYFAVTGA
jgi:hypothetical protein